jgi:hypothetical protein
MGSVTAEVCCQGQGTLSFSRGSVVSLLLAGTAAAALGIWIASLGAKLPEPSTFVNELSTGDAGSKTRDGGGSGYKFRYPAGWELQTEGAVSKVSSPDRRMVVSVGPGPAGSLRQTADAFVALFERQYQSPEVSSRGRLSVGGSPALLTGGTAINDHGAEMRLFSIALKKAGRNYVITGFSDAAAVEPSTLSARVQEIAQTLEATSRT